MSDRNSNSANQNKQGSTHGEKNLPSLEIIIPMPNVKPPLDNPPSQINPPSQTSNNPPQESEQQSPPQE
jgi:hypothetical protein